MKKTIYLANALGFSELTKTLLPKLTSELEALGLEVWEPFTRNALPPSSGLPWASAVGRKCVADVKNADALFAVVNGTPPDEGVMVEIGVAVAMDKPTFLFRDDFRSCSDSSYYPLNLMAFVGIPVVSWRDFYYKSIHEITSKDKALFRWAKS